MKENLIKKLVIAVFIICLIALYKILDLGRYISISHLKASPQMLGALYSARPVLFVTAYMLIYILYSSLPLPGAEMLSIAGGMLFGVLPGTVIVSFASSIGATMACLISRFLFRDWVQSRFGDKVSTINCKIERDGAFYLFSLRLMPAIPYFAVNLLMGLSPMPLRTFYVVSQIGMLPTTLLFVNAGKQMININSAADVLSMRLLLSLALLGLFPLAAKKMLILYKSRR